MEDILLKRMAVRSTGFMLAVIMISVVCRNYNGIEIFANANKISDNVETSSLNVDDKKSMNNMMLSSIEKDGDYGNPEKILRDKYIIVKKPSSKESEISLEDLYMEHSIQITVSGLKPEELDSDSVIRVNKQEHFKGEPLAKEGDFVQNIGITYDYNTEQRKNTATIHVELDSVYAYSLYQDNQNYYINLQNPRDVYDKLIVIDAGHGGNDVGTFPKDMSYFEKDINLSVVLNLKELLDLEDIKVYYTRLTDVKLYLKPRVNLANDLDADLFISIHCNGSDLGQPHGTEVLYNEKWKGQGFGSKELADICIDELTKTIGLRNRGLVKGSEKYIVGHSKVPVALIEVAYMTNQEDLEFLKDSNNHKLAAKGIYNGIMRYYEEYDNKN